MVEIQKHRIIDIKELCQGTYRYRLEPIDGKLIDYKPGQFAFLHIIDEEGNSIVKRPYSIASNPEAEYLEFCIKLVNGELTGMLEKLEKGAVVGIQPGGGHFIYDDEKNAAFISGGTGIAPIISILRHIRQKKIDGRFIVFYSARTEKDILYKDELEELDKQPNIKIVITLTRQEWEGEKGRLCNAIISRYAPDAKDFRWWLCGHLAMVKNMKNCLVGLGTDPEGIKIEGWG